MNVNTWPDIHTSSLDTNTINRKRYEGRKEGGWCKLDRGAENEKHCMCSNESDVCVLGRRRPNNSTILNRTKRNISRSFQTFSGIVFVVYQPMYYANKSVMQAKADE